MPSELQRDANTINALIIPAIVGGILYLIYMSFPVFLMISEEFQAGPEKEKIISVARVKFVGIYKTVGIDWHIDSPLPKEGMLKTGKALGHYQLLSFDDENLLKGIPGGEIYMSFEGRYSEYTMMQNTPSTANLYYATIQPAYAQGDIAKLMYEEWEWPIEVPIAFGWFFGILHIGCLFLIGLIAFAVLLFTSYRAHRQNNG